MGTPIKDRGIRWEENYGDKSLYLKQNFEEQVGPGSYFRWEGHDSTSGADYYAVVTPGFSKNHGFHFFAALRKMPADNGASGKKFKNQAEALSYAFETWRVPPPKTKPHKPYISRDLEGKPIVMENVHDAASDVWMVKEAMAFMSSGYAGAVFPNEGPKELYSRLFQAGVNGLIMNRGAAPIRPSSGRLQISTTKAPAEFSIRRPIRQEAESLLASLPVSRHRKSSGMR